MICMMSSSRLHPTVRKVFFYMLQSATRDPVLKFRRRTTGSRWRWWQMHSLACSAHSFCSWSACYCSAYSRWVPGTFCLIGPIYVLVHAVQILVMWRCLVSNIICGFAGWNCSFDVAQHSLCIQPSSVTAPHTCSPCFMSMLQDFLDGAEIRSMGGSALLDLSVPGAVALPFAPPADVRAALLQVCTHPQLAAPSSSDAATQVCAWQDLTHAPQACTACSCRRQVLATPAMLSSDGWCACQVSLAQRCVRKDCPLAGRD
jgi:hypothetical protein